MSGPESNDSFLYTDLIDLNIGEKDIGHQSTDILGLRK